MNQPLLIFTSKYTVISSNNMANRKVLSRTELHRLSLTEMV